MIFRTIYPASYVPAAQTKKGFLYNPIMARLLATFAEYEFYKTEGELFDVPYWYRITIFGETLSWLHLIFQSELLGLVEDSTWWLFQTNALVYSTMPMDGKLFLLIYCVVVVRGHLPALVKRIKWPYFSLLTAIPVRDIDRYSRYWITTSVILKFTMYRYLLYMNRRSLKR